MFKYEKKYDLDDPRTTLYHKEIIKNKLFLKKLYISWYQQQIAYAGKNNFGKKNLEIGSGGGFLKEVFPDVITSDILELGCDMTFPGEKMPFENNSLNSVMMLNVLHHIPDTEGFLKEAFRVLTSGGRIIMIEPANTPFSRFIYKNFHHEPFLPEAKEWKVDPGNPLSNSNQALPWIVFERDVKIFNEKFPELKVTEIKYHTPFAYLISGGVSFKALVPSWSFGIIRGIEKLLSPFSKYIGMFVTIVVEKK